MQPKSRFYILVFSIFSILIFSGCSDSSDSEDPPSQSKKKVEETDFCSTISLDSSEVTVTSRAQFKPRALKSGGLGNEDSAVDIKYAEVKIFDSSGKVIQCGETDETGNISLSIPEKTGDYTLKVYSRSNPESDIYRVSVLNNPTNNEPYEISASFTLSESQTTVDVTLDAADPSSPKVLGGAFNIMNQIYIANEYLRNNTACTEANSVSCSTFTVAPKIQIFWTAGLSPGAYYDSSSSGISFFSPQDSTKMSRGLYILGGINGDINCADTDHFDNSVILHEYGHFLEDTFSKSDSPGGSHNGDFIIDPRLAWSEGWANFFQAAVSDISSYTDTYGNSSCSSGNYGLGVQLDLKTPTSGQDLMSSSTTSGEGVFREVSVSRSLFHTLKTESPYNGPGVGFPLIWRAFVESTGLGASDIHFRSVGKFNELIKSAISTYYSTEKDSAYTAIVDGEYSKTDTSEYGVPVSWQSTSCSRTMTAVSLKSDPYGSFVTNLLESNDFFSYYYDGTSSTKSMTFTISSGSSLNLIIYSEEHVLDEDGAKGEIAKHTSISSSKTVSFSDQKEGWYLIQVQAKTSGTRTYRFTNNSGKYLCSNDTGTL